MHRQTVSACVCIAAVLLGACAKSDQPAAVDTAAKTIAAPAVPNVVLVRARDFAFDAPDAIPAGMTTFRLLNDGQALHHVQIVRLDSGKTMADLEKAMKAMTSPGTPPRWAVWAGGPNGIDPQGEGNATLDMPAGNYALLCFVDFPDHIPHFVKGMVKPLTVTPSTAPSAPAPKADVVVTLNDYSFTVSAPVAAGKHTFEVRNAAAQTHELFIVQLAPGKTAADFKAWVGKMKGPPPGRAIGGTAGAATGMPVYFTADITPGIYLLMCFIPDAKDGKPHLEHGMFQEVKVN